VLCEKPLTTSRKDSEELVRLARTKQTLLVEAMWTRCLPAYLRARDWFAREKLVRCSASVRNSAHKNEMDPGNRFYNPDLGAAACLTWGCTWWNFPLAS